MSKRAWTSQQKTSDHAINDFVFDLRQSELSHDVLLVRGSGNQDHAPGDIDTVLQMENSYRTLIEHKATEKGSRSISLKEMKKISEEAKSVGRSPAMGLSLWDEQERRFKHFLVLPLPW